MRHQDVYKNKVVVLTGATSGIGREMCLQLASAGAHLVMAARNEAALEAMAETCEQRGGMAQAVVTDVTEEGACQHLIEQTISMHGRLDVLVNNAGLSMWSRVDEMQDLELLRHIMAVNYLGSAYCTFYALPYLKQSTGRVGVIASLTGRIPVPTRAGYAASKIAMTRFHESLRVELHGTGVSVTIIFPDFVATNIRSHSRGPDNKPLGYSPAQEHKMMSAQRCAEIALGAIARRQRGTILSLRGNAAVFAKQIWPGLVDLIARRAIRSGK